ncbi:hypothetical protein P3X46_025465 [Hevea brasiliensis]|uniref:Dirigent protein n=1 Tax=Hevea brasiliensis TaxID=3981 RepID=A0ABQ9L5M6_HEVBR|nr:dirigent protein 16-like [Hevea brasiliensis]KAJ9160024.1 hypothetical protein P3X46_025465 [Hevea brasiliensis]
MAKKPSILVITSLLFFMTIINQSSSARNLGNPPPANSHHHHNHPQITFLMQNVLNVTYPSPNPATTKFTSPIPFSKPLGYFPPNGGIPLPQSNPMLPTTGVSMQNIGLSFPASAALQEMELGSVVEIDENLFEGTIYGSLVVGKAQGIFVASSENGTSHMVAMTANFGKNESKDGLKFFGVYKRVVPESHIAVIGGTGKFHAANGYAVIKAVDGGFSALGEEANKRKKLLSFNVYLMK